MATAASTIQRGGRASSSAAGPSHSGSAPSSRERGGHEPRGGLAGAFEPASSEPAAAPSSRGQRRACTTTSMSNSIAQAAAMRENGCAAAGEHRARRRRAGGRERPAERSRSAVRARRRRPVRARRAGRATRPPRSPATPKRGGLQVLRGCAERSEQEQGGGGQPRESSGQRGHGVAGFALSRGSFDDQLDGRADRRQQRGVAAHRTVGADAEAAARIR